MLRQVHQRSEIVRCELSKLLRKRGINTSASLCDQPQSTEALAKTSGTQPNALYRVPRLLASVGIFEWEHGAWHHTDGSRFLRSDHPGSLRDYVLMLGLPVFWNAFGDLDHSLRTGKSAFATHHSEGVFEYLAKHSEESHIFDAAMVSKSHRAHQVGQLPIRVVPDICPPWK